MRFRYFLQGIRSRWAWVLLCVLIGGAGATLYSARVAPTFQASAQIYVTGGTVGQPPANARVRSYAKLVNVPAVTTKVLAELHLDRSPASLAKEISADVPAGELIINVHVADKSASTAAQVCNAVAGSFIDTVQSLEQDGPGTASIRLSVTRPATIPDEPIRPDKPLDIIVGALAGLLAGLVLVVVRSALDRTVHNGPELKELVRLPLLGTIPQDKKAEAEPLAFRADSHGPRAEGYRQLRSNLQFIGVDSPPRIIAVTSASPEEGKSLTAINLAAALAESGRRVCLIEADLRRPTIARTLGLVGNVGLTSVLTGSASIRDVVQNSGKNLVVLASGPIPPNPSEILLSVQFRNLVAAIAEQVEYVVLDTAPLLAVADGAEIASIAEAVLLVVRARKTKREHVYRAAETLQRVNDRPVGVVLNRARLVSTQKDSYTFRPEAVASEGAQPRRRRRGKDV